MFVRRTSSGVDAVRRGGSVQSGGTYCSLASLAYRFLSSLFLTRSDRIERWHVSWCSETTSGNGGFPFVSHFQQEVAHLIGSPLTLAPNSIKNTVTLVTHYLLDHDLGRIFVGIFLCCLTFRRICMERARVSVGGTRRSSRKI